MRGKRITLLFIITAFFFNSYAQPVYSYGTYTGDDAATLTVGYIGFQPEVVIVFPLSASYVGWCATSDMPAGYAKKLSGNVALVTGRMDAFLANGFRVGTNDDANKLGVKYFFIAFNENSDVYVNSFVGEGDAAQAITGAGFAPQMVWLFGDHTNAPLLGQASNITYCVDWTNGNNVGASSIASYDADGFTAATNHNTAHNYYYVAFKESGTVMRESSYNGNGTDGRDVAFAATTFQPDLMFISTGTASLGAISVKMAGNGLDGDNTILSPGSAVTTDRIQAFNTDGFEVGGSSAINWGGASAYPYVAFSGGNTLPIELLSFNVQDKNGSIEINWSTLSEINNDYFTIERSNDLIGDKWEALKQVQGAGNSNHLIEYSEMDYSPLEGASYYRIKQTDYDGKFTYSQTASVGTSIITNLTLTVAPNPIDDYTFVDFGTENNSNLDLSIYDQNGTKMKQIIKGHFDKGSYKVLVYTNELAAGTYFFRLNSDTEGIASKVVIR